MTDFKTKAFQENIEILKGMDEKGTITRNEIADCERSIRLIQVGKDEMRREITKRFENWFKEGLENGNFAMVLKESKELIGEIE